MTLLRFVLLAFVWFVASSAFTSAAGEFTMEKTDRGVTVKLDGQMFTEYLTNSGEKPILWPIIGPTGKPMTRSYPMERVEGEKTDHVHHRSLWFTHGKVNDKDFWLEGRNRGTTRHREFAEVEGGDTGRIVTMNDWLGPDGKKVCEDRREFTFRDEGDARVIDCDITVTASDGPVTFGDTKEGSFGIRVPEAMRVEARQGGKIVNSEGHIDDEAWAKRAAWVDYHGPVHGERAGIAILNHPSSFRFPTHWHVRGYGLFAANPFGVHDFEGTGDGSHTIPAGESMRLRYRVVFHKGDEKEGRIAERFESYSNEK